MRSLTMFFALFVVFMTPGSLAHAQGGDPSSKNDGSAPVAATKEEVNQLRSEVAAQRQTIQELGGTMPEHLPSAESIKKIARQRHTRLVKATEE